MFTEEWTAVTRVKNTDDWQFQTECGMSKLYRKQFFDDPRQSAITASEKHKH